MTKLFDAVKKCMENFKVLPLLDHSWFLVKHNHSFLFRKITHWSLLFIKNIINKSSIFVDMDNQATKTSSRDDGLGTRSATSTNMLHETDLSAARSDTIV